MDIAAGTTFAGYRIERVLGSGGMGTVYLAQHPRLPRKDALKVLSVERSAGARFRADFLREAEVAARLKHPNLVAVRDRGEYAGRLWIGMQYVAGVDLATLIRHRRETLSPERVVRILTEAAQGLDELHRAGLLHRDVKPANVLIAEEPGQPDRVLVTDFGIARPIEESTTTVGGSFTGTLAYAAPEQLEDGPIDHRADIYALGCTLFQMLTGSLPFPRETPGSLMYAHMHEDPPRPSSVDPGVPRGFDAVVARAMAKEPGDRYTTCGEFAAAAQAALTAVVEPPARRFDRRRLGVLVAVAVSPILVAAGIAAVRLLGSDAPQALPILSNRPVTGTVEPALWGNYAYMAEAFPDLLPASPFGGGYQELSGCIPMDEKSGSMSWDTVDPNALLYCVGNSDPVYSLFLYCNADRSIISPEFAVATVEGDERWSRASGSGYLFWSTGFLPGGDLTINDRPLGVLDVYFDDPDRNFCRIQVYGNTATGAELRASWWPDAPL